MEWSDLEGGKGCLCFKILLSNKDKMIEGFLKHVLSVYTIHNHYQVSMLDIDFKGLTQVDNILRTGKCDFLSNVCYILGFLLSEYQLCINFKLV